MTARMQAAVSNPGPTSWGTALAASSSDAAGQNPPSTPRPCSPPAPSTTPRSRSTAAPSASTRPAPAQDRPGAGLQGLHRHRRPRPRSARVAGVRLRPGRRLRGAGGVDRQLVAGRRAAGLGPVVKRLPVMPPVKPMLAKLSRELPEGDGLLYEPKWDGFRCIVFRDGDDIELGSRNEKPLRAISPSWWSLCVPTFPSGASSTARSSSPPTTASTSRPCSSASTPPRPASRSWQRRHRRRSSPSTSWPSTTATFARSPSPNGAPCSRSYARTSTHPSTSRPRPTTRRWRAPGSTASRAPASMASWSRSPSSRTSETSGRW